MTQKEILNRASKWLVALTAISALSACKIVISDGGTSTVTQPQESSECGGVSQGVNWGALLKHNCPKLSDYNLFQDPSDPTDNPSAGGIPYDLSTALFTDYASKYRYIFVPEGEKAQYSEHEVLDFPVGSVLVKTFAMPDDTAFRDGAETVIETRLLIHREDGWVARPYYWDTENDATLALSGKDIPDMTTVHNGEQLSFTYSVPKATSCTSCHSVVPLLQGPDDKRQAIFKPIGPKARFLNSDYDYGNRIENQLSHWQDQGVLEGLPAMSEVSQAPVFNESTSIVGLDDDTLMDYAKSYLDINCAHCHRSELTLPEPLYAGPAGGSGLQVEYNRDYAEDPAKFGACKVPVAGGHPDYSADVIPLDPDDSYLLFRMSTTDERHRMPELGRSIVHQEGVALIREWISRLPAESCSPAT